MKTAAMGSPYEKDGQAPKAPAVKCLRLLSLGNIENESDQANHNEVTGVNREMALSGGRDQSPLPHCREIAIPEPCPSPPPGTAEGEEAGDRGASRVSMCAPVEESAAARLYKFVINTSSGALFYLLNFNPCQDESWRSYPEWQPPDWAGRSKTTQNWLETRRAASEEKDLWRVHDKFYDLQAFVKNHPGGEYWLAVTRGTDVTEAFESHHVSDKARQVLSKYFVREAKTKRNSPFTFEKNGFYNTLREKVKSKLSKLPPGPSVKSKIIMDTLLTGTIISSVLAARNDSIVLALLAALFLNCTIVCSHNFFHMKDNWRMYLFNLSLMSVRDWRISHSMSHHLYTNSLHDLEISMFEPWFQWLPRPDKSITARYLPYLYWPLVYLLLFVAEALSRLMVHPDGLRELIPLVLPACMIACQVPVLKALFWWLVIIMVTSFIFGCVGLNAAHHHPEIFHDGDDPRSDRDWGLYQLDTVRDRKEIKGLLPFVLVLFGDHTLHHLFPTVDHAYLEPLYPVLEETCKEFGIDFQLTTIVDLIIGQFKQLAKINKK